MKFAPVLVILALSCGALVAPVSGLALASGELDGYHVGSYGLRELAVKDLPGFTPTLVPRVDDTPHDNAGVRLYQAHDGQLYDHPVRQAAYGLSNLNSYRVTQDRFYLDRALAQADRLVETADVRDDAWFFPYPFDFDLHGANKWLMEAPWYSGMAQGEALRLFVRLADVTHDPRWNKAADATYQSFWLDRSPGVPWVSSVDAEGYLWFEEYAQDSGMNQTFNGHMFAVWGLFEYAQKTGNAEAAQLTKAGLATVEHYAPRFRSPGGLSLYCLSHRVQSRGYHTVHISMFLQLYRFTGDDSFAGWADTYTRDYPYRDRSGRVVFAAGKHEAIKVDKAGTVVARFTGSLAAASHADASARVSLPGQPGVWYKIANGMFAGWSVRESAAVRMVGEYDSLDYQPARRAVVREGTHVGQKFNAKYGLVAEKSARLGRDSVASIERRSWINGAERVLVTNGIWGGYWLPASALR